MVATLEECAVAVEQLGQLMSGHSDKARGFPDRTISCTIPDLAVTFRGRIADGSLIDIVADEDESTERAQIRLTLHSDDLIALVSGELNAGKAFASGRLKVDASFGDLLRLRSLG